MRWLAFLLILLGAATAPAPAISSDWHRAESPNYIVHAQLDEAELRALVEEIEEYRRVLHALFPTEERTGRKLQFYLDRNTRRIEWAFQMRVAGFGGAKADFAGAFVEYDPRADERLRRGTIQFQQTQYYIDGGFFRTLPLWMLAGAPAAMKTSFRDEEGRFLVGVPDNRAPVDRGLDAERIEEVLGVEYILRDERQYRRFYTTSREMARVLLLDLGFSGRMEAYVDALTNGASLAAAKSALGDLTALAEAINALGAAREQQLRLVTLPPAAPPAIEIRAMTRAEVDLVADRFARLAGRRLETVSKRLQKLTRKHPQSSEVWYEYAAAQYALVRRSLFGGEPAFRGFGFSNSRIIVAPDPYSDRLAWEAVNRALELEPDHAPARVLKAEILIARLLKIDDEDLSGEFEAVRALLEPLAARPEAYPLAAAVSYQSYLEQEIEPTPAALERLGRAFVANRGVPEFRYAYASALARVGEQETARTLLKAMLSDPAFREGAQNALDQTRAQ